MRGQKDHKTTATPTFVCNIDHEGINTTKMAMLIRKRKFINRKIIKELEKNIAYMEKVVKDFNQAIKDIQSFFTNRMRKFLARRTKRFLNNL